MCYTPIVFLEKLIAAVLALTGAALTAFTF